MTYQKQNVNAFRGILLQLGTYPLSSVIQVLRVQYVRYNYTGALYGMHLILNRMDRCALTYNCLLLSLMCCTVYPFPTLYRKSHLCIPRNETVQPIPNSYIHVSISNLIYSLTDT